MISRSSRFFSKCFFLMMIIIIAVLKLFQNYNLILFELKTRDFFYNNIFFYVKFFKLFCATKLNFAFEKIMHLRCYIFFLNSLFFCFLHLFEFKYWCFSRFYILRFDFFDKKRLLYYFLLKLMNWLKVEKEIYQSLFWI